MIGSDTGTAAATFQSSAPFDILSDYVGVETAAQFDACQIALLAVDGVVVAGRQQNRYFVLVEFLAQLRRH